MNDREARRFPRPEVEPPGPVPGGPLQRPEPTLPCTGACRGDRPAWDSPAQIGRKPDGSRVLFCTCCMHTLIPVDTLDPAPNVIALIDKAKAKRWTCEACGYDTVVLQELKAKA
jgi:hypothetical protein